MNPRARNLLLVLTAVVVVALGINVHYRALGSAQRRSDFIVFHAAGAALLRGADPYDVAHERGWPFLYPPGAAVLFAPLGALPLGVAVVLWYALSVGALGWGVRRSVQLCDRAAGRPTGPVVIGMLLVNAGPIVSGLQRGQISALLFGLMAEAIWQGLRARGVASGAWVGIGIALKVYPGLLALPAVGALGRAGARRSTLALLLGAAGAVTIATLSPALLGGPSYGAELAATFVERGRAAAGAPGAGPDVLGSVEHFSPSNQSLYATAARWLCRSAPRDPFAPDLALADWSPEAVRRATLAVAALLAGLIVWAGQRRGTTGVRLPVLAVWLLPLVAMNFVTPIAWHHYYTVLALPYAVVAVAALDERRVAWRRALTAGLVVAIAGNWLHFAVFPLRQAGVLLLGTLALWVVLWAWVMATGWRASAAGPDSPFVKG